MESSLRSGDMEDRNLQNYGQGSSENQISAHPFYAQKHHSQFPPYALPYSSPSDPNYAFNQAYHPQNEASMYGQQKSQHHQAPVYNQQNSSHCQETVYHQLNSYHSQTPLYNQPNSSHDKAQDYSGKKDTSRELSYFDDSEKSFDSSSEILDISNSKPQQSTNNSNNSIPSVECSTNNHPQSSSPQNGPVVKITDVASGPLNTTGDERTENQANDSQPKERDLSQNYVYRILSRSLYGKIELHKQKQLEVMAAELKARMESQQSEPTKKRLFFIGKELVKVFIFEDIATYIGENTDGSLKGKLPSRVRTVRSRAIRTNFWESPRDQKKKSEVTVSTLQSIAYFKTNKTIDANLITEWNGNRDAIIQFFRKNSILSIFSEFLFLSEENGYERLVDDYDSQRQVQVGLIQKWPSVASVVLAIAKRAASKGSRHKKDLRQIVSGNIAPGAKKQDHIQNIALISLPHILGSVTCKVVPNSKDSWKASVAQAQECFILHIEDHLKEKEELPKRTKALKALFTKHDLPLNPYVVAVGKLDAIKNCYVVLEDFRYRIEGPKSLVKSVDICYKCTYTLQKQPPRPSSLAWQLLRQHIYGDPGDIDIEEYACQI
ncbi:hypothetical protein QAD02_013923 [Eretmocerus hayati]|uniref:Uncharacterized protein n=1 Tax=Eretmocerus hayati TaxID=131215 RepID=A0ACC2P536_9HYME|nr:hypothetical protein QAD02_013923 [Eretmocerus hayati]